MFYERLERIYRFNPNNTDRKIRYIKQKQERKDVINALHNENQVRLLAQKIKEHEEDELDEEAIRKAKELSDGPNGGR
jgi:tRNA A37 threonylcarbamoyladenosine synthetase subunit TsaC/SUA5/YrdC